MTREDIDNIVRMICPNDEDFEKSCISPAYLKKELEVLALEQEPTGDLISRQGVLDAMYELCDTGENLKDNLWRDNPHIDAITDAINELSSAEKTGRWVEIDEEPHEVWECDHCGFVIDGSGCIDPIEYRDTFKYCPWCGVRMRGDGE